MWTHCQRTQQEILVVTRESLLQNKILVSLQPSCVFVSTTSAPYQYNQVKGQPFVVTELKITTFEETPQGLHCQRKKLVLSIRRYLSRVVDEFTSRRVYKLLYAMMRGFTSWRVNELTSCLLRVKRIEVIMVWIMNFPNSELMVIIIVELWIMNSELIVITIMNYEFWIMN